VKDFVMVDHKTVPRNGGLERTAHGDIDYFSSHLRFWNKHTTPA
jgi:hypothetical protein